MCVVISFGGFYARILNTLSVYIRWLAAQSGTWAQSFGAGRITAGMLGACEFSLVFVTPECWRFSAAFFISLSPSPFTHVARLCVHVFCVVSAPKCRQNAFCNARMYLMVVFGKINPHLLNTIIMGRHSSFNKYKFA